MPPVYHAPHAVGQLGLQKQIQLKLFGHSLIADQNSYPLQKFYEELVIWRLELSVS